MEVVRGGTIAQDKMLHGVNPLVELLGQISGSNCWVKIDNRICWVEFVIEFKSAGRIAGSNSWVKSVGLPVKLLVQIPRSNCPVTPDVTPVTHASKRGESLALSVPA